MAAQMEPRIAALLREAAAAHSVYEKNELGGVFDEAWPAWYAAYLIEHGLPDVLPAAAARGGDRLAELLAQSDEAFRREQPSGEWPEYYAGRLLSALG